MRIDRVYTRAGDGGNTRLVMGREVVKDDPRIEAYGTVDELNAILGLARSFHEQVPAEDPRGVAIGHMLRRIQDDLFLVGADLATRAADRWKGMVRVSDEDVQRLESWIDAMNKELGPLEDFILPGGGPVGAFLHQGRTVCRRAERRVVTLIRVEPDVGWEVIRFLNRLSDLLFVLARYAARVRGEPDHLWRNPARTSREEGGQDAESSQDEHGDLEKE